MLVVVGLLVLASTAAQGQIVPCTPSADGLTFDCGQESFSIANLTGNSTSFFCTPRVSFAGTYYYFCFQVSPLGLPAAFTVVLSGVSYTCNTTIYGGGGTYMAVQISAVSKSCWGLGSKLVSSEYDESQGQQSLILNYNGGMGTRTTSLTINCGPQAVPSKFTVAEVPGGQYFLQMTSSAGCPLNSTLSSYVSCDVASNLQATCGDSHFDISSLQAANSPTLSFATDDDDALFLFQVTHDGLANNVKDCALPHAGAVAAMLNTTTGQCVALGQSDMIKSWTYLPFKHNGELQIEYSTSTNQTSLVAVIQCALIQDAVITSAGIGDSDTASRVVIEHCCACLDGCELD